MNVRGVFLKMYSARHNLHHNLSKIYLTMMSIRD